MEDFVIVELQNNEGDLKFIFKDIHPSDVFTRHSKSYITYKSRDLVIHRYADAPCHLFVVNLHKHSRPNKQAFACVSLRANIDAAKEVLRQTAQKELKDMLLSVSAMDKNIDNNLKPLPKEKFYLRLFHGRTSPTEELEEWGQDGPVLGPFDYFHSTYMSQLVLEYTDDSGIQTECFLEIIKDLVYYDKMFYGDFEILPGDYVAKHNIKASEFSAELATLDRSGATQAEPEQAPITEHAPPKALEDFFEDWELLPNPRKVREGVVSGDDLYRFDIVDEDLTLVRSMEGRIWTRLLTNDAIIITPGFHIVDRECYYLSMVKNAGASEYVDEDPKTYLSPNTVVTCDKVTLVLSTSGWELGDILGTCKFQGHEVEDIYDDPYIVED